MNNALLVFSFGLCHLSMVVAAPCDIYDAALTPCVAAHSTVRALYDSYAGPLYLVNRSSDGATKEISVKAAGGYADSEVQDLFCVNVDCIVQRIFDQSPRGNHLDIAPAGGQAPKDRGVNASKHKLMVGGQAVYGAYFEGGMGYRIENTSGVAIDDQPETMYMVTAGRHYNDGCCFDYGNAETDAHDHGPATMEAIYWGNYSWCAKGSGNGPWVLADLEEGLWGGSEHITMSNTPIDADFVTALLKGKAGLFGLKGGNAQSGPLKTLYEGKRPPNYDPMKKQGAIILGIGGDNSNKAVGTFYEGVITYGYTSDATDDAVQANIVAAGYGQSKLRAEQYVV